MDARVQYRKRGEAAHAREKTRSNKYALLTKREVKMAGYFYVFMDRDEKKKKKKKKERGQYPAILTEQAWSIKELLYGQVSSSRRRRMFSLVTSKINRGKVIFVHLTLSDACNNQFFINCFICNVNELSKPASSNFFFAGARWSHLVRSGSQSEHRIPLAEPAK